MVVKFLVDKRPLRQLARKANVGHVTIWNIKTGKTSRIRQATKRKILASINPGIIKQMRFTNSTGKDDSQED